MHNFQGFHGAVSAIYDAAADFDRWPSALQQIATILDAKGCQLTAWRGASLVFSLHSGKTAGDVSASRGDLPEPGSGRASPSQAALEFRLNPQTRAVLCVEYGAEGGQAVGLDGGALFEAFASHVWRALRLASEMVEAKAEAAAMAHAISALDYGVLLLDRDGRLMLCNGAARRLLGRRLKVDSQRRAHLDGQLLRQALRGRAQRSRAASPALVFKEEARVRCSAYAIELRGLQGSLRQSALQQADTLVLLCSVGREVTINAAMLEAIFGVSNGEARLASLSQAAARLGIAESSARTILKRVFTKTRMSRQSELSLAVRNMAIRHGAGANSTHATVEAEP